MRQLIADFAKKFLSVFRSEKKTYFKLALTLATYVRWQDHRNGITLSETSRFSFIQQLLRAEGRSTDITEVELIDQISSLLPDEVVARCIRDTEVFLQYDADVAGVSFKIVKLRHKEKNARILQLNEEIKARRTSRIGS